MSVAHLGMAGGEILISMRIAALVMACGCLWAGPAEVRLAGPWTVSVTVDGVRGEVAVPPVDVVTVTDERYEKLPEFNYKTTAGWTKGARLTGVIAAECTTQGALDPGSVVVRDGEGVFRMGVDYDADLAAGTVGRIPGGGIGAEQAVQVSYRYSKMRIDAIVVTAAGRVELRRGVPHVVTPEAAAVGAGERRVANVFVSGRIEGLSEDNLFPVLEDAYPETGRAVAGELLPKTLARLRKGERLRVLAWGDSVTTYNRYQTMFVERLRARYPKAQIELVTEAWGGRNTGSYLKEPPGSPHNYKEKVLGAKADLIVSEFVNDASLNEEQVEARYSQLLADFQGIGAEWIILTPHYIRLDWMGLTRQREIDEDPRPYVLGVRQFAARHRIALADASLRYGRLWRRGIPFLTLMENNINHPNVFGHSLFADSLISLFP